MKFFNRAWNTAKFEAGDVAKMYRTASPRNRKVMFVVHTLIAVWFVAAVSQFATAHSAESVSTVQAGGAWGQGAGMDSDYSKYGALFPN